MLSSVSALLRLLGATAIAAALLVASAGAASAATSWNASSPLGMNLNGVTSYSTEQPFLDIFVTNDGWITHAKKVWDTHEEQYLELDADGYPRTLTATSADSRSPQVFDSVGVVLEGQGGRYLYPAGKYVVLYDGKGKLAYGSDARLISSAPGRDLIEVARPSAAGIDLRIIRTDSGDHLRNIRLVRQRDEAALAAGRMFEPAFLDLLKRFRVLRFMDWLGTNGSTLAAWSERPVRGYYSWGTGKGVPIEVAVTLANAISADAWLNVPAMADDDYIRRMAALVHRQLGATQKVYVEYSNEVWNGSFPQYRYAASRGSTQWPDRAPGDDEYEWNRNWYGMRTAQICDIWKAVWGSDRDRVICVLAAQAANTYSATDSLDCPYWAAGAPCSGHGIGAVAIAPYFGDRPLPARWFAQAEGGLGLLFGSLGSPDESGTSALLDGLSGWAARMRAELARRHLIVPASGGDADVPTGGWFQEVSRWETSYTASLAHYRLPLIAYEGGQSFVGGANAQATRLSIAANRDPRMGAAYTEYLRQWRAKGGQLFVLFNDVGAYSRYGEWGSLESLRQPHESADQPPKWRAIQDFMRGTACWWPGCAAAH